MVSIDFNFNKFMLITLANGYSFQNCFSAVRGRGGFNDHPTTRQAATALSTLSTNNFLRQHMASSTSVEEFDEDAVVVVGGPLSDAAGVPVDPTKSCKL